MISYAAVAAAAWSVFTYSSSTYVSSLPVFFAAFRIIPWLNIKHTHIACEADDQPRSVMSGVQERPCQIVLEKIQKYNKK